MKKNGFTRTRTNFQKENLRGRGFTLIELLIVISIIASIIAFAVPNFLGARQRANDTKKKAELVQLKNALRLYYNDYNKYPTWTNGMAICGCGINGDTTCPPGTNSTQCGQTDSCASINGADFTAGGTDGCGTIYMKKLPIIGTSQTYRYYQVKNGDDFRIKINLDNLSDPDLISSQARCPIVAATNPEGNIGSQWGSNDYVLCAD